MKTKIETADFRALAALRYRIRLFLHEVDAAVRRAGLEPQHYSLLLAVRGIPEGVEATIQALAERLLLKHNSTVELVDRLERRGYVRRSRSRDDRRCVRVELLPRGEELVERVARRRLTELHTGGAALANALDTLLSRRPKSRGVKRRTHQSQNQTGQTRRRGKASEQG